MDTQQPAETSALEDFIRLGDWVKQSHMPAVPTRSSADWLVKMHRAELVACGALIPGRGRSGSLVHRKLFPQAIVGILKRQAAA